MLTLLIYLFFLFFCNYFFPINFFINVINFLINIMYYFININNVTTMYIFLDEYEQNQGVNLDRFFSSTKDNFTHPEVSYNTLKKY